MRYGSVCSGIEGASASWCALGWECRWTSEIEPFCCELIRQRWGHRNLGSLIEIEGPPAVDLLVGGTPCQSFSVNGLRKGLDESRGNLSLHFCRLAGDIRPEWIVWENVPGVFSTNGGRDFGSILGALAKLGYGFAYRVLDVRYFGVPQRRRRVYVVGNRRSINRAAAVLFDGPAPGGNGGTIAKTRKEARPKDHGTSLFGWSGDTTPKFGVECVPTLRAYQGGEGVGIIGDGIFRRLTVTEWERLQGYPDDYTAIEINGKIAGDSVRRTALGNAFSVPVIRWIGERIQAVEEICSAELV